MFLPAKQRKRGNYSAGGKKGSVVRILMVYGPAYRMVSVGKDKELCSTSNKIVFHDENHN